MAKWWYSAAGEAAGPLEDDQLRAMAGVGALSPGSPVYREDVGQWRPLEDFETALGLGRNAWGAYFVPAAGEPAVGADLTEPATPWQRLAAAWVDAVVVRAVCWAVVVVLHPAWSGGSLAGLLAVLALAEAVPFAYETLLHAVRGQTVGKRLLGIEVVGRDASELLGLGRAFARSLIGAMTWPVTIAMVLFTADRRGLHDRAVNSWVQKVR